MQGTWQDRLKEAVAADGRSMRAISDAADLGHNFLSELFNKRKEPGIDKLRRLCDELHVSVTYIVTGVDIGPEDEGFLALLAGLDEADRSTLTDLARKLQKPALPSK